MFLLQASTFFTIRGERTSKGLPERMLNDYTISWCSCRQPLLHVQAQYREEVSGLRLAVERVLAELLLGPHSSPVTRLALLPHVATVADFLGRK